MQKERITKKLAAIKNLAQQGIGGEKETALRLYGELRQKYDISEADMEAVADPDTTEEKEDSNILFLLWILENNLQEEKLLCHKCTTKDNCRNCSTYENRKDLEMQYKVLKRCLESE